MGVLPHTLALLELMADPMWAPVCSLERWRYFNMVANRPAFHPKLAPRTRAFPPGKAAKCASFWISRNTGSHLLLWAPVFTCFPARGGVQSRAVSWQRLLLKWARACRQPGSQCAPNRRERRCTGAPTACLWLGSFQTAGSQLWVCGRRVQWSGRVF